MSRVAACTLFTRNHLPRARVLQCSLHQLHPEMELFMLATDLPGEGRATAGEAARTWMLGAHDVMAPEQVTRLGALYSAMEYCAAFKPALIAHLLGLGYDKILYLDTDLLILNPLDGLIDALDDASILLTPHLLDPAAARGKEQAELEILLTGSFNTGFIGVSAGAEADAFLGWWHARVQTHGFDDRANGMFSDQRWMDLAPGFFGGVKVLRHPGCNVAHWNLHSRTVSQAGDRWLASGQDLVFFHFSGFDPGNPQVLSKWQDPALPLDPPVAKLAGDYARALQEADFDGTSKTPYAFGYFSNGVPFSWFCRHLLRRAPDLLKEFPRPLDVREPSFFDWLMEPTSHAPDGASLSRYAELFHGAHANLQSAFPDPLGQDRQAWHQWLLWNRNHVPEAFVGDLKQ
jgi:hypothetical protein